MVEQLHKLHFQPFWFHFTFLQSRCLLSNGNLLKFLLQFYLLTFLFQFSVTNFVACFQSYNFLLQFFCLLSDKQLLHLLLKLAALDRNQKVACPECGTKVSKQNLAVHKKRCLVGTLSCSKCPNFSTSQP